MGDGSWTWQETFARGHDPALTGLECTCCDEARGPTPADARLQLVHERAG